MRERRNKCIREYYERERERERSEKEWERDRRECKSVDGYCENLYFRL